MISSLKKNKRKVCYFKNDNLSLPCSTNWPPQEGSPARGPSAAEESSLPSLNVEKCFLCSGNPVSAEILKEQEEGRDTLSLGVLPRPFAYTSPPNDHK